MHGAKNSPTAAKNLHRFWRAGFFLPSTGQIRTFSRGFTLGFIFWSRPEKYIFGAFCCLESPHLHFHTLLERILVPHRESFFTLNSKLSCMAPVASRLPATGKIKLLLPKRKSFKWGYAIANNSRISIQFLKLFQVSIRMLFYCQTHFTKYLLTWLTKT